MKYSTLPTLQYLFFKVYYLGYFLSAVPPTVLGSPPKVHIFINPVPRSYFHKSVPRSPPKVHIRRPLRPEA